MRRPDRGLALLVPLLLAAIPVWGAPALSDELPAYFISGSADSTMKLWRTSDGVCLRTYDGHAENVRSVRIFADGQRMLTGSWDHTLKQWDIETGAVLQTYAGHTDQVFGVEILPDQEEALSCAFDNTIRLWQLSSGDCLRVFTGHTDGIRAIKLTPDGEQVLSGSEDNTMKLWRIADGTCIRTFTGHTSWVGSVDVSPDGLYALSGSLDHTMKLWRISDGECLRTFLGHTDWVRSVCFTPDGLQAFSTSSDHAEAVGSRLRDMHPHLHRTHRQRMPRDRFCGRPKRPDGELGSDHPPVADRRRRMPADLHRTLPAHLRAGMVRGIPGGAAGRGTGVLRERSAESDAGHVPGGLSRRRRRPAGNRYSRPVGPTEELKRERSVLVP
jgi:hypothetical protein